MPPIDNSGIDAMLRGGKSSQALMKVGNSQNDFLTQGGNLVDGLNTLLDKIFKLRDKVPQVQEMINPEQQTEQQNLKNMPAAEIVGSVDPPKEEIKIKPLPKLVIDEKALQSKIKFLRTMLENQKGATAGDLLKNFNDEDPQVMEILRSTILSVVKFEE
ncbi:MAG: hypothetical protein IH845_05135 [Nanoarchaeota archaeon]|nr:hypothetical protein [Nanoarchaeota archaeon]